MNRSLLWLILGLSTALHAGGFLLLRSVPVRSVSTAPAAGSSEPFILNADGFQVSTLPAPQAEPAPVLTRDSAPSAFSTLVTVANREGTASLRPVVATESPSAPVAPAPRHTVVFLLDKSGSMYETVGGVRRVELATRELRKMINQLDAHTAFNVVLYAEKVVNFQSAPIPATAENKLAALRFLQADTPCGGSTDFPSGYQAALAQRADTVLLLTDGEFNTSEQAVIASMKTLRQKYNVRAPLNVLGFYVRPDTSAGKMLARLCAETHGELQFWKLNGGRYASLE